MKQGKRNERVGQVLLPGDRVLNELPTTGKLRLGPGLQISQQQVIATQVGVLHQAKSGKLWLKTQQKRYTPAIDESIIGIIQDRNSEVFLVEIHTSCLAELPVTSFENVTKRNVPPLKPGDLVHARVTSAFPFTHPTLSCVDGNDKAAGMGILKNGTTLRVTTSFARSLLSTPLHPVLSLLGEKWKFEMVVGLNGVVWIHAPSAAQAVFLSHVLEKCDGRDRASAEEFCRQELDRTQPHL